MTGKKINNQSFLEDFEKKLESSSSIKPKQC